MNGVLTPNKSDFTTSLLAAPFAHRLRRAPRRTARVRLTARVRAEGSER
ncbi:MAG TPA: hypothetical protein VKY73_21050 [Polyangiaceae bacterium]|nr:hypothetical protein [Polyangiaceae bacterium]